MKIFVTVGTTPFDSLIKEASLLKSSETILQVGESDIEASNCKIIKFTINIVEYYLWADIVICHAGAGTIYQLLEMDKSIIVVPNLERSDQHQNEITNFIESNNFGLVARDVKKLKEILLKVGAFKKNKYAKEEFFLAKEIINLI
jgi:beta-1,4-N-acetylglucosaminyltransferase